MKNRSYGFVRRRFREVLESGGSELELALFKSGGAWLVGQGIPDGYFVQDGGALVIDEGVASGLPFSLNGPLVVETV